MSPLLKEAIKESLKLPSLVFGVNQKFLLSQEPDYRNAPTAPAITEGNLSSNTTKCHVFRIYHHQFDFIW